MRQAPAEIAGANNMPVQSLAHAVQALKLVIAALKIRSGQVIDRRKRMGVVGCELWKDKIAPRQKPLRAGEITDVRIGFMRVDRIVRKSIHLRALDLAVPVSALHEAYHETPPGALRQGYKIIDYEWRALLVGLDHEAKPLPIAQPAIGRERLQKIERRLQAIGLFGVHIEADAMPPRAEDKGPQPSIELVPNPAHLRVAIARMQRRQFHRNSRRAVDAAASATGADRLNGVPIRRHVTRRVAGRGRCLAKHVEGVEKAARLKGPPMLQRLLDGLTGHKLPAKEPHRQVHRLADNGLAATGQRASEGGRHAGLAVRGNELAGDQQAPGRRVYQP